MSTPPASPCSKNSSSTRPGKRLSSWLLSTGTTPLQVLLDAGADVNAAITDTTSVTAAWPRHASITDRQGQTAIHGPGKWGWLKVAQFLVEHGARVDVTDFYGKTPMDSAMARAGGEQEELYPELAEYLQAQL